jgi:putative SOS response-associated peptidase YedK
LASRQEDLPMRHRAPYLFLMCNDYEQHIRYAEYRQALGEVGLVPAAHQGEADLPPADDIRIGDLGPVMRKEGGEVTLSSMTFGFPPPAGKKAGPVFNFRSEGRSFGESRRCLIPASAFFEFTGTKYPKAKHRFTLNAAPFLCIAGLWRDAPVGGDSNQPPAFTMLTTAPGPDVAPIHNRQVVVLKPEAWRHWLDLDTPEAELLLPLPAGSLDVEQVRAGSD